MPVIHELSFNPKVLEELEQGFSWYEASRKGLGREFLDEANRIFDQIQAEPTRFGFFSSDIREAGLNRFPFVIYYRIIDLSVRVLTVHHTSRDPSRWRRRN